MRLWGAKYQLCHLIGCEFRWEFNTVLHTLTRLMYITRQRFGDSMELSGEVMWHPLYSGTYAVSIMSTILTMAISICQTFFLNSQTCVLYMCQSTMMDVLFRNCGLYNVEDKVRNIWESVSWVIWSKCQFCWFLLSRMWWKISEFRKNYNIYLGVALWLFTEYLFSQIFFAAMTSRTIFS